MCHEDRGYKGTQGTKMTGGKKRTQKQKQKIPRGTWMSVSSECCVFSANRIQAYYANQKKLRDTYINRGTKMQIYKSLIRTVVTYGCESWTMKKVDENIL
jgi:heme/copper-type cytochrome/quinol oxidase subunit 3